MEFIAILVVLVLQRFMKLNSYSRQFDWMTPYYNWLQQKFSYINKGHPLLTMAGIIIPVLLGMGLIFALLYALTFTVGYFIASVALLWYCIDGRDLHYEPYVDTEPKNILLRRYSDLFALLFWFYFFGVVGLVLYVSIVALIKTLSADHTEKPIFDYANKVQAVLDWVPVRLLGLTFAVVGHFGVVFKLWFKHAWEGLENSPHLIVRWGVAALTPAQAVKQGDEQSLVKIDDKQVVQLLDRALLVWLIVMAILEVHNWIR